jgi:glutathione S-transferase
MRPFDTPLLLVTIPQSHFCEKARWALDRAGAPYREDAHLPMFHLPATFLRGGGPTVPVLKTRSSTLSDSTDILHYLDTFLPEERRLFPAQDSLRQEVSRLEDRFDQALGPAGRSWVYWHLLPNKELSVSIVDKHVPGYQSVVGRALFGVVRGMINRKYKLTDERGEAALNTVRQIFDEVGQLLSDGRKFLVGDRLSAADIAFASLGAVVLLPPQYGGPLPTIEQAPPRMREAIEELRAHEAGRFILRLYQEHRR